MIGVSDFPAASVPDLHGVIPRGRGDGDAIGGPCHGEYLVTMAPVGEARSFNSHELMLSRSLGQQINGMWQNWQDVLQALLHRFRTAGKINNERASTRPGNPA